MIYIFFFNAGTQTCSSAPQKLKKCSHEYLPFFYDVTVEACNAVGTAYCTGEGNGFRTEEECYSTCQGNYFIEQY